MLQTREAGDFLKDHHNCLPQLQNVEMPAELMILGRIFALIEHPLQRGGNIRAVLRSAAPPRDVALGLCDNFFHYGAWL